MKFTTIDSINLDITQPMPFKSDDLSFNKINIMTGMNGSGKSFILVHSFIFTEVAKLIKFGLKDEQLLASAQFIYEKCFTEINTSGKINVNFQTGDIAEKVFDIKPVRIEMELENGKIINLRHFWFETVNEVSSINYMSASTRTFNAIKAYLNLRKMINKTYDAETAMLEILKMYKLYDYAFLEGLISKMPAKLTPVFTEHFTKFFPDKKIVEVGIDEEINDFYFLEDGKTDKKYMTSLGAGEQSIFNMLLGNI